ncbi:hypothetical protein M2D63_020450 [Pseudomonas sp. BJa5]|uniref:hypothetical protein n=1 Tax=Pseudomonas sp. BJa5 TaxID=2936270 RepID=UPI0025595875|nr:hypothetical protein [Pseudomonas sp. BGr12]MDL2423484.1 hypothetical protein [Pseudomonas sp. BGr12]
MKTDGPTLQWLSSLIQVISVVVGVVMSVISFNSARESEATARKLEAAKPFYVLRQNLYHEVVKVVGILVNPQFHTTDEINKAKARFRELYIAELSMVEAPEVEAKMKALAAKIDPTLLAMTEEQIAAYQLAHALRDTFTHDWKADQQDSMKR